MNGVLALCIAIAATVASPAQSDEDIHLPHLLVGKWRSPRHDYLHAADGTWRMLPPAATHGHWRIEDHQLIISWSDPELRNRPPARYNIQYIRSGEIPYGGVYYMKRLAD
jgi:hypothetical protein